MKTVRMIMIHFNDTRIFSEKFLNTTCHFNLVGCEFELDVFIIIPLVLNQSFHHPDNFLHIYMNTYSSSDLVNISDVYSLVSM